MRKKLLLISIMAVWLAFMYGCGSGETIEFSKIQKRKGLLYKVNSDKLFTGRIVKYFSGNQKKEIVVEIEVKNGKKHGKYISWNENGQKSSEGDYVDGKLHGKDLYWSENGQKLGERNYKDGKINGKIKIWNEKGELFEINTVEVSKIQEKNGITYKINDQTPFSGKVFDYYENGPKRTEISYNNGITHGSLSFWYKNGNKKVTGNFREGKKHGKFVFYEENGEILKEEYYENGAEIYR